MRRRSARRGSELENPLPPEGPADAVLEPAEAGAGNISLIIPGIVVARDVENLQADRGVVTEQAEFLGHLRVERDEARIAAGLVARPDEVAIGVDDREREARADVEHRKDGEAARQRE